VLYAHLVGISPIVSYFLSVFSCGNINDLL